MKKKFVYFIILFSAIVLQTSMLPVILHGRPTGDVVLMLILAGAVLDGFLSFIWWSVFAGIMYDLATYMPIGVHSLIFLLVLYFVSFFSRRLSLELRGVGLALFMAFVVAASFISRIITTLSVFLEGQKNHSYFGLFGSLGIFSLEILYNAVLFILCFMLLKRVKIFFAIN